MTNHRRRTWRNCILIVALTLISTAIALPSYWQWSGQVSGQEKTFTFNKEYWEISFFGKKYSFNLPLKRGLDLAGGMQVVLKADMSQISNEDRLTALSAARQVIAGRIDAYGLTEPMIQTSINGDDYRIIVELPEISDAEQALSLIGQTAQLDFRVQDPVKAAAAEAEMASASAEGQMSLSAYFAYLDSYNQTELTGDKLKKATSQFDPQTGKPVVALEFNDQGKELFGQLTLANQGGVLGIFIDGSPIMSPRINSPILDGQAIIQGDFTLDDANNLAIQLNSGALPVPVTVLEQRNIGATLGDTSIKLSIQAGLIGLIAVALFMILNYGGKGLISLLGLGVYTAVIIAIYKIFGVTLTLAGIAGLIISIGMAVDSNILIFERMKDEMRRGVPRHKAMELGFGRAWDSIRDANVITLVIATVLANPFNFSFLNTSGSVRGFGITLLIGTLVALFTGIFVTRNFMRLVFDQPTGKAHS